MIPDSTYPSIHPFFSSSRGWKFLFQCADCEMILAVEFEAEEHRKAINDKMMLECPCGGCCHVLHN